MCDDIKLNGRWLRRIVLISILYSFYSAGSLCRQIKRVEWITIRIVPGCERARLSWKVSRIPNDVNAFESVLWDYLIVAQASSSDSLCFFIYSQIKFTWSTSSGCNKGECRMKCHYLPPQITAPTAARGKDADVNSMRNLGHNHHVRHRCIANGSSSSHWYHVLLNVFTQLLNNINT